MNHFQSTFLQSIWWAIVDSAFSHVKLVTKDLSACWLSNFFRTLSYVSTETISTLILIFKKFCREGIRNWFIEKYILISTGRQNGNQTRELPTFSYNNLKGPLRNQCLSHLPELKEEKKNCCTECASWLVNLIERRSTVMDKALKEKD